jgi:hypothetical protein
VRLISVTISCKKPTSLTSSHLRLIPTPPFKLPERLVCQSLPPRICTHALSFVPLGLGSTI